jgi:hypothetical protein
MFTQPLNFEPIINHILNQPLTNEINYINYNYIYTRYSYLVKAKTVFVHLFVHFLGQGFKGFKEFKHHFPVINIYIYFLRRVAPWRA